MRSLNEIQFRLRQEVYNRYLSAFPPSLPASTLPPAASTRLPDPVEVAARLRKTAFAAECLEIAEEILHGRFRLLGLTVETGQDIRWRRDYVHDKETGAEFFRRIPYLDFARAGDHKVIWELNRHQHLVVLAQAYLFSGRQEFLDEVVRQLESWFAQNPFQRGMNWASALEVAFRALSWIWIHRLIGDRLSPPVRDRLLTWLYWHGLHLETNLSYYFSPNTHLLGEAVALHALGECFPAFPRSSQWRETGARVVRHELDRQVLADGCHFELSTYYHVYALDMFMFHAILHGLDAAYREKLAAMAAFLDAIIGPSGILPLIGDDDGGRFFHPYGPRGRFALATLATAGVLLDRPEWVRDPRYVDEQAAWWLNPQTIEPVIRPAPESRCFRDSGLVVMAAAGAQLIVDAGSFGPGRAGHSHADALAVILRLDGDQILIDPGTYTYIADPAWRDRFRGAAAHNTIRVDGLDPAAPAGPFAWQSRIETKILQWDSSPQRDILVAACSYNGCTHQRTITFEKTSLKVTICDRLEGSGEHLVEQFWHFGEPVRQCSAQSFLIGSRVCISFDPAFEPRLYEGEDYGWISPALGVKLPSPAICLARRAAFPVSLMTTVDMQPRNG